MPSVVINEFEVTPEPPEAPKTRSAGGEGKEDAGDAQKPPISDFEFKKMMERGLKRLERVSAH